MMGEFKQICRLFKFTQTTTSRHFYSFNFHTIKVLLIFSNQAVIKV